MTPVPSGAPNPAEKSVALTAALREARIDAAERSGVIVDLHDAQLARLEILNEALDPLFAALPDRVDIFDRGISRGDTPRLWIDMLAHIAMGPDKRVYRFLQDTRYGRKVLAESAQVDVIVKAITQYVAHRLIERERALAGAAPERDAEGRPSARAGRGPVWFVLGMMAGAAALLAAAWFIAPMLR
jgi:hypothetical protein